MQKRHMPSLQKLNAPLIASGIFLIPLLIYFFAYVPAQEKHTISREFRILNDITYQINTKIEQLRTAFLNSARSDYLTDGEKKYRARLSLIPDIKLTDFSVGQAIYSNNLFPRHIKFQNDSLYKNQQYKLLTELTREDDIWYLQFTYTDIRGKGSVFIKATIDLSGLILPVLNQSQFDELMVTDQGGHVLLTTGRMEFRAAQLDSVISEEKKKIPFHLVGRRSSLVEFDFASERYKVFIHPLHIPAWNPAEGSTGFDWAICGLQRASSFRSQTYAISYNAIIIFMFFVIITTIGWPLIKLWQMGPHNRFRRSDMLFLVFSFFVGCPLWSVALQDVHYYLNVRHVIDRQMGILSAQIEQNFRNELADALGQLSLLNKLYKDPPTDKDQLHGVKGNVLADPQIGPQSLKYPFYEMAFWVDKAGWQRSKWSIRSSPTSLVNVRKRDYFRKIIEKQFWTLETDSGSYKYWLQPLNSLTTGTNEAVVSVPFREADNPIKLAAMVIRPASLMNTVLPPGFGFSLIDRDGFVLFHSDQSRNLRENFLKECYDDKDLAAALYGRTPARISLKYEGRGTRLFIRPLAGTDWHLVTFASLTGLRTANLEILTISLTLILLNVLVILIIFLTVRLLRPDYRAVWMWVDPRFARIYHQLLISHLAIILFFLLILFTYGKEQSFLMLVVLPLFTLVLTILKLKIEHQRIVKKKTDRIREIYCPRKILIFSLAGLILSPLLYHTGFSVQSVWHQWLPTLADSAFMLLISVFLLPDRESYPLKSIQFLSFRTRYILILVSVLMIVFVLPSVGLFRVLSQTETAMLARNTQYKMAERLAERQVRIGLEDEDIRQLKQVALKRSHSRGGTHGRDLYLNCFFGTTLNRTDGRDNDQQATRLHPVYGGFKKFLSYIRFPYNTASIETGGIMGGAAGDSLWTAGRRITGRMPFTFRTQSGQTIVLVSRLEYLSNLSYILWVIGFVLFIIILYALMRVIMQRVVFLDFEDIEGRSIKVRSQDFLRRAKFGQHTFIYAPPSSRKSTLLAKNHDIILVDMMAVVQSPNWVENFRHYPLPTASGKAIALDHFDCHIDDDSLNRQKLAFLEQLIYHHQKTVVIVSTVDQNYLIDKGDKSVNAKGNKDKDTTTHFSWSAMLSKFRFIYLDDQPVSDRAFENIVSKFRNELGRPPLPSEKPLWWKWNQLCPRLMQKLFRAGDLTASVQTGQTDPVVEELCKTLRKECIINPKMTEIAKGILSDRNCQTLSREQLVNEIMSRAKPYYQVLWSTCSAAEKLVLIQIAEEGVPNLKNAGVVRGLLRRKLLRSRPYIKLMNESFRRFVLAVYQPDDILAEETSSRWNSIKAPLLLMTAALLVFLFMTQQEFLNETIALVSTFVALIPALIKMFSLFSVPRLRLTGPSDE